MSTPSKYDAGDLVVVGLILFLLGILGGVAVGLRIVENPTNEHPCADGGREVRVVQGGSTRFVCECAR